MTRVINARRCRLALPVLVFVALFASTGHAASWIENRSLSFDTTLDTGAGVVRDDQVYAKSWRQTPLIRTLGLPENVELAALALQSGDAFLVSDISYTLSDQLVTPRDVVRRTSSGVSTVFLAGSSLGLPPTTRIISLAFSGSDVLFSLDTAATIGAITCRPNDILRWNGTTVTIAHAGSATGIPNGTSITGLERLASGRLLITLDAHAQFGGVVSGPSDILEYDPVSGVWDLSRSSARLGVTCQPCSIGALAADGPSGAIFRSGLEAFED
jgi:hypothetical protein